MSPRERAARLRKAAELVSEVAGDLDITSDPCKCCGSKRYRHFDQYQAHDELTSSAQKLRRWADRFSV